MIRKMWASSIVTFVLFVVVCSVLTPFSAGSGAAIDWAITWAVVLTVVYALGRHRLNKRKIT